MASHGRQVAAPLILDSCSAFLIRDTLQPQHKMLLRLHREDVTRRGRAVDLQRTKDAEGRGCFRAPFSFVGERAELVSSHSLSQFSTGPLWTSADLCIARPQGRKMDACPEVCPSAARLLGTAAVTDSTARAPNGSERRKAKTAADTSNEEPILGPDPKSIQTHTVTHPDDERWLEKDTEANAGSLFSKFLPKSSFL